MQTVEQTRETSPALSWESGYARVNNVKLAWEQTGPKNGEPLLLVMGLAWQLIHWPTHFCEALVAKGFRVIRFDNRDIGLSSSADRGVRFDVMKDSLRKKLGLSVRSNYRLHDMAADAKGLLDALDVEKAHVVGISMGGMISQLLAGLHAPRVKSLTSIMSSTNHPWLPLPDLTVMKNMLAPLPKDAARDHIVERSLKMVKLLASPAFPSEHHEQRAMCEAAYDRAFRPSGMLRQTHAIIATGSIEREVRRITAPTQIVHGLADKLVRPAGGKRSAKLIRDARLTLIEGMGHDLPRSLTPRLVMSITDNAARA